MTALTFALREKAAKAKQARREHLSQVPYEYAKFLETRPKGSFVNVRLLPRPKEEIIRAILFCIANSRSKREIALLSDALTSLALIQDLGNCDVISPPNANVFNIDTEVGSRQFLEAMKKFSSLDRQYAPLMHKDMEFFRLWRKRAVEANEHMWPVYRRWWEKLRSPIPRKIPADWIDFPD